jgi:hypothetical protein
LVILLALVQIIQFAAVLKMQDEVVVIKKNHPHQKCKSGNEVFIFEGFEEFHGIRNKVNVMFLMQDSEAII